MDAANDSRLPLTIVTGFLGSGKTTLIRRLLARPEFADAAIIVNELGEIGIDHRLFRQTDERITLLSGGCACCARRDDLVAALTDLLRRFDRNARPRFDRVVVETTGLANPAPILHTIVADPLLNRRFRIEQVVTTLDAVTGERTLSNYAEAVHQVTAADAVIVTKSDLAPAAAETLAALIANLNPAASVQTATYGDLDSGARPHGARREPSGDATLTRAHQATRLHEPGGVSTLNLDLDIPLDWPMFGLWLTMLLHAQGPRVLRVKGLLDVGSTGPLLLEGVQHVVHAPRHLSAWPPGERRSQLVFIVRDLEPEQIRASLDAFQRLAVRPHRPASVTQ